MVQNGKFEIGFQKNTDVRTKSPEKTILRKRLFFVFRKSLFYFKLIFRKRLFLCYKIVFSGRCVISCHFPEMTIITFHKSIFDYFLFFHKSIFECQWKMLKSNFENGSKSIFDDIQSATENNKSNQKKKHLSILCNFA